MNQFTLEILKRLKELSKPYIDIRDLESDYDTKSTDFIAAFRRLESDCLIASANTSGCGLRVGADGYAGWAVVDLYVTDCGDAILNPQEAPKEPFTTWLVKPVVVAVSIALILWLSSQAYSHFQPTEQVPAEKDQKSIQYKINSPKPTLINQSSTLDKSSNLPVVSGEGSQEVNIGE